ncbi:hypothetical protein SDC9_82366 [bioreactor metagenome]|uniref:Uncharacterized protein n=1 Tax=bioreactor metagenome TaxID=1076179 RepID=A0A644Z4Q2_9ZZZZ
MGLTEVLLREKLSAAGVQLGENSKIEGIMPSPYGEYNVYISNDKIRSVKTYTLKIPEARSELFTCHASDSEDIEETFDVINTVMLKNVCVIERYRLPRTSSEELNTIITSDFFKFADENAVFSDKRKELAYYVNFKIRRTYGLERIEVHYITFDEYGRKSDEIKKYFCETTTGAYWRDGDEVPEDIIKTLALNFTDRLQMFVGDVSAVNPLKTDVNSVAAAIYLTGRTAIDPAKISVYTHNSRKMINISIQEIKSIFSDCFSTVFEIGPDKINFCDNYTILTQNDSGYHLEITNASTVLNRPLSEIGIVGNRITVDAVCEYAARFGFTYGRKTMRYEFQFDGLELKLITAKTINDSEEEPVSSENYLGYGEGWNKIDLTEQVKKAGYDVILRYYGYSRDEWVLPYAPVIAANKSNYTSTIDGKVTDCFTGLTLLFYDIEHDCLCDRKIVINDSDYIRADLSCALSTIDGFLYIKTSVYSSEGNLNKTYRLEYDGSFNPSLINAQPELIDMADGEIYNIPTKIEAGGWVAERDSDGSIYATRISDGEKKVLYEGIPVEITVEGSTAARLFGVISEKYIVYSIYGWEWSIGYGVFNTETGTNWLVKNGKSLYCARGDYLILLDDTNLEYTKITSPYETFNLTEYINEGDSIYIDENFENITVVNWSSSTSDNYLGIYTFKRESDKLVPKSFDRITGNNAGERVIISGGYALVSSNDMKEFISKKLIY